MMMMMIEYFAIRRSVCVSKDVRSCVVKRAREREKFLNKVRKKKERVLLFFSFRSSPVDGWKTKRGQKKRSQEDKKDKTSFDDARLFAPVNTNAKM